MPIMPLRALTPPVAFCLGLLALATDVPTIGFEATPSEIGAYGERTLQDLADESPEAVAPTVESPFGSGSVGMRVRRNPSSAGTTDAIRPAPGRNSVRRVVRDADAARSGIRFVGSPLGATRTGWTTGTPPPVGLPI
jgi:hypothetical protein